MKYDLTTDWQFRQFGKKDWLPATVPGCIHLDLLNNALIEDPFYRDNETKVQWIDKENWEYRLLFDIPAELFSKQRIQLVFEGIDTYATVILNDQPILNADNMYRRWQVDVKSILNEQGNMLSICFRSPIREILPQLEKMEFKLPAVNDPTAGTSPYTRKAPYHYGWDWGPRLVTCGLWQPVKLEAWDHIKIINQNFIVTKLTSKKVLLEVMTEVLSDKAASATLKIFDDKNQVTITEKIKLRIGLNKVKTQIAIRNPELWWPNGYGDQPLYKLETEISLDKERISHCQRIGLRTIELKREPDQWGESFTFIVNGVPIYAKGADWIPSDNFTMRISAEKYRYLLSSAVQANMNMLRVWGGGIYEADSFYDLCDELGILIWQDFMFSCSLYPGDEKFLNSVQEEATYQVRRLRHHPCIALWCGNNEIEMGWHDWGWQEKFPATLWEDYLKLFHGILPEVCYAEDPSRTYWPSSPASDLDAIYNPNDSARGDTHYWGVWHKQEPFDFYQQHFPRFISEYGFQSFPEPESVRKFAIEADHDIFSPVMLIHQKSGNGNALIKSYMEKYFKIPKDFDHFLLLSQVLQAEGIKSGAEHFRRIRPRCMGSLYWQINDCWPVASWSSIDYYGRWKALHYYARRFYAPILLSPNFENDTYKLYIVSDVSESLPARLEIALMNFSGEVHSKFEKSLLIHPYESVVYYTIAKKDLPQQIDPRATFMYCALEDQRGNILSDNSIYFELPKNLKLTQPQISYKITKLDAEFLISLSSKNLARSVILKIEGIDGFFEDNFFDLYPGQNREIHFKINSDIHETDFKKAFSIISLFDLMEMNE